MFYWFLKWIAIGPVLKLVFRPQVSGQENVPATGPAILASNHLSYADWLFMPLTLSRRVTFVAKAEYFNTPGIKGWFQKKFFSGAGQVPIDRSGASAAEGALSSARRILTEGDLFGIYPEGTRSHDGKLYRGKTGVARLALECKVPVIPTAVVGTDVVAPPGQTFGKFTRPIVRFGKPLDFSRYEGMENDRYILRSITDEIMYEIMRLSGQEYVDQYASQGQGGGQASRARGEGWPPRPARSTRSSTGRRRRPDRPRGVRGEAVTGPKDRSRRRTPPADRLVRAGHDRRGPDVPLAGGAPGDRARQRRRAGRLPLRQRPEAGRGGRVRRGDGGLDRRSRAGPTSSRPGDGRRCCWPTSRWPWR